MTLTRCSVLDILSLKYLFDVQVKHGIHRKAHEFEAQKEEKSRIPYEISVSKTRGYDKELRLEALQHYNVGRRNSQRLKGNNQEI